MPERQMEAAYAFVGDERRVVRKIRALRQHFGAADVIRLPEGTAADAVMACQELGLQPDRLIVADARAWGKNDFEPVLLYLLDPTPGTVLALWCKDVPRPLAAAVGQTFKLAGEPVENKLWPMIDAWGENRRGRTLDYLGQQLAEGASPFMLLAVLTSQVRLVLSVKNFAAQGMRAGELADMLGKSEWSIRKAHQQGKRRTSEKLTEYLCILEAADDRMKGGGRAPVEFELVQAIARLF